MQLKTLQVLEKKKENKPECPLHSFKMFPQSRDGSKAIQNRLVGTAIIFLLTAAPAMAAVTVNPTSEPEDAAVTEGTAEPITEPQPFSEVGGSPNAMEIIFPPLSLMIIICSGLFILWIRAKVKRDEHDAHKLTDDYFMQPSLRNLTTSFGGSIMAGVQELKDASKYAFLSMEDIQTINSMELFFNQPLPLCRIALPALLSLAFCPFVLYIYEPVVGFFWPPSDFPNGAPNINDSIACFLAPAGLVYATSFGFSYQSAMQKQRSLVSIVSNEVSKLDQILTMTSHLTYITLKEKAKIYHFVKDEAITIIRQVQMLCKGSCEDYEGTQCSGQIWRIVPLLRHSGTRQKKWHLDRHILDSMLDHVVALNSDSSERYEVMMSPIHPLKWIFLELLGFFSFFGVLLLRAHSYRMELAMCIMTVFSITLLCYVVADMDSPFNGFFRVNLSALPQIVKKSSIFYQHAIDGKNVDGPADPGKMTAEGCLVDTIEDESAHCVYASTHSVDEVVLHTYDHDFGELDA